MPNFLTLSYSVRDGTPNLRDACSALMPVRTASIADMMSCLVYCLYLFHSGLWDGTYVAIPGVTIPPKKITHTGAVDAQPKGRRLKKKRKKRKKSNKMMPGASIWREGWWLSEASQGVQ